MVLESLLAHKWTVLFYGLIILLLYIYRKSFDTQGKFVKLYRTRLGLNLMNSISSKVPRLVRGLGYVGIYVGYAGMLLIVAFIFYGLYQMAFVPDAPPPIQPVIPGVPIPGSAIQVPLIIGWIALFISAVVHEFSHGVVARAHKLPVKSSGFAFIGPLAAAFVEPDEQKLAKAKGKVQNSVYAAGPFSNVILAGLMLLLIGFAWMPLVNNYLQPEGFRFESVTEGLPADAAGIEPGVVYTIVDGESMESHLDFYKAIENVTPGQMVVIGNAQSTHEVVLTEHPDDSDKGYFGVINTKTAFSNEHSVLAMILLWLLDLFNWVFIISLGLGLANLLPIGPVDGGRLFHTASLKFFGKKKGKKIWGYVTVLFLGLLILLFLPIIWETLKALLNLFIPGLNS